MAGFSAEQRRNAAIIISVGRSLGASSRDIQIALMAALQESRLRNLNYGDRDSIGMFQQRNAWGTRAARLDPHRSARMFFLGGAGGQRGLFDFRSRSSMSLTRAAQAVQVSAFPNAYAKHEQAAASLLGLGTSAAAGAPGGGWTRPVRGGRLTQGQGVANPRYASGRHTGVDWAVPVGTPVYAPSGGKVVRVTRGGSYGLRIEIAHNGKLFSLLAHLSMANVRVGDTVQAGQLIGKSGNSGNTSGPHLHYELRQGVNAYGHDINPMDFINGNTTPSAYLQPGTTTVQGNAADYMGDEIDQAISMTMPKPYVYMNPMDVLAADQVPLGDDDPLAAFGVGAKPEEAPPSTVGLEAGDELALLEMRSV